MPCAAQDAAAAEADGGVDAGGQLCSLAALLAIAVLTAHPQAGAGGFAPSARALARGDGQGDGDGANLLLQRRHHLAKMLLNGGVDGAAERLHST